LFTGWTAATPAVEWARSLLDGWDAVLRRDSTAAAIYAAWRDASLPEERDGTRPAVDRHARHEASLAQAIEQLTRTLGPDREQWRWGRLHTRAFPHPLVSAFDLPFVERPGGAGTLAADGASYREILDVADWDRSMATNVPGQSAQPGSPFYDNLLRLWADDTYFPLLFTRARIERDAAHRMELRAR
jgi:penicillin amidase